MVSLQPLNELISCLSEYQNRIGVYIIGSIANNDFLINWSDIDICILAEKRDRALLSVVSKYIISANKQYKNIIAGGGDSPIDITILDVDYYLNKLLVHEYISAYDSLLIRTIVETKHYGKLILGDGTLLNRFPVESIGENRLISAFIYPSYNESLYIMDCINNNRHSPVRVVFNNKDRRVIKYFLSTYRSYILLTYSEFIAKSTPIEQFALNGKLCELIKAAQTVRENSNTTDVKEIVEFLYDNLFQHVEWYINVCKEICFKIYNIKYLFNRRTNISTGCSKIEKIQTMNNRHMGTVLLC